MNVYEETKDLIAELKRNHEKAVGVVLCPVCGGRVKFAVAAGLTKGKCGTPGCLNWRNE